MSPALHRARTNLGLALATIVIGFALPGTANAQVTPAQFGVDDPYIPLGDDDSAASKDLAMPDGPDEEVFLRAIPDKTKAYVGEQVTLSVYLYYRVAYEMSERHDPHYSGFLRFSLLNDPGATSPVYTKVKSKRYGARLVERVALIPLRAGDLATGPISSRFKGRQIGARVLKSSNDVVIHVEEPPKEGRPKSFVSGDVGRFTVSATVTPRQTRQGGSVAVIVKVEGTGNVPSNLQPPVKPGEKWLAPTRKDAMTTKLGKIGGSRTFEYVVRLGNAGETELGAFELAFFDPVKKEYVVSRTELGKVQVEEAPPTDAEVARAKRGSGGSGMQDPLKELPTHRTKLAPFTPKETATISMPLFVLGLAVPPALALLLIALVRASGVVAERRKASGGVLRGKVKEALSAAAKADKANEPRAVCGAIEKALHAAVEAGTGLKSRAYRLDELPPKLVLAGVAQSVADELRAVLSECESLRYAPSLDEEALQGLRARAKSLTKKLAG